MAVDHVRVGVRLASHPDDLAEWLADARAFEAAGVEALVVEPDPDTRLDPFALAAALAVLTHRCLLATPPAPDPDESPTMATLARLSRGRLRTMDELHWFPVPSPDSRAAWRSALDEAAASGHDGIIVAAGPRLLDILRNPDEPGERLDLHLAQ